jgi:N-acetylneuraminic acid mutarotase
VIGSTAYLLGGSNGTSTQTAVLSTSDGAHFTSAGSLALGVRFPAVAAVGHSIFVIGGETGSGAAAPDTTDIQRFDPATGVTAVIGHLPVALAGASAVVLGGDLYVVGGQTATSAVATIYEVDAATGQVASAGSLPAGVAFGGIAVEGSTAYLLGGETSGPTAPVAGVITLSVAHPGGSSAT